MDFERGALGMKNKFAPFFLMSETSMNFLINFKSRTPNLQISAKFTILEIKKANALKININVFTCFIFRKSENCKAKNPVPLFIHRAMSSMYFHVIFMSLPSILVYSFVFNPIR